MARLALFGLLAALAGCAVTTAGGERLTLGSDRFRAYVERVFREQNRIASAIAFTLEAEGLDDARAAALERAEQALLDACAELNRLAAARRDGESLGTIDATSAARSAPACEQATLAAERILEAD